MLKKLVVDSYRDVFCMQEIELKNGYRVALLSFPNFNLEVEENTVNARVGIYINNEVNHVRRTDLEKN
jgi:hypothetical protein